MWMTIKSVCTVVDDHEEYPECVSIVCISCDSLYGSFTSHLSEVGSQRPEAICDDWGPD